MSKARKQKLYCYVDEIGQDTEGQLFLVSVVVTEQEQEAFARELERIEAESGPEVGHFSSELRKLHIRIRKVRGARDEAEPGIRLADAFAGFIRDALEEEAYAQELYQEARKRGFVREA